MVQRLLLLIFTFTITTLAGNSAGNKVSENKKVATKVHSNNPTVTTSEPTITGNEEPFSITEESLNKLTCHEAWRQLIKASNRKLGTDLKFKDDGNDMEACPIGCGVCILFSASTAYVPPYVAGTLAASTLCAVSKCGSDFINSPRQCVCSPCSNTIHSYDILLASGICCWCVVASASGDQVQCDLIDTVISDIKMLGTASVAAVKGCIGCFACYSICQKVQDVCTKKEIKNEGKVE